jgi:hypothetical protein
MSSCGHELGFYSGFLRLDCWLLDIISSKYHARSKTVMYLKLNYSDVVLFLLSIVFTVNFFLNLPTSDEQLQSWITSGQDWHVQVLKCQTQNFLRTTITTQVGSATRHVSSCCVKHFQTECQCVCRVHEPRACAWAPGPRVSSHMCRYSKIWRNPESKALPFSRISLSRMLNLYLQFHRFSLCVDLFLVANIGNRFVFKEYPATFPALFSLYSSGMRTSQFLCTWSRS